MLCILAGNDNFDQKFFPVINKLCNLSGITFVSEKPENAASFISGTTGFYIPLTSVLDVEAELKKIDEELEYHRGFLSSVMKKLGNERFVQNAPAAVIELERKKQSDAEQRIKSLEGRRRELIKSLSRDQFSNEIILVSFLQLPSFIKDEVPSFSGYMVFFG
jgi:valyl-tRNA synthetase